MEIIQEMKIGIPRAFLYYKNHAFWASYFEYLGVETIISPPSDRQILAEGVRLAVDESCLPAKIFLGHAAYLADKCDKIFVPRIGSLGKNDMVCVKLLALFDILKNTLKAPLLGCNTDVNDGQSEMTAYIKLGRELGYNRRKSAAAYARGKTTQKRADISTYLAAREQLSSSKIKLLVAGHGYNVFDEIIGRPILDAFKKLGAEAIAATDFAAVNPQRFSELVSRDLYWTYNKELAGAAYAYKTRVDGIVLLSAFPCGPDSLVNELLIYKLAGVPILNIVADEHQSQTGLLTRAESFLDILAAKREARAL